MRDILAPANRGALEPFARPRTLLALDFDGTLAPIVADRDRAAMRPSTRRLLLRAARAYPCVVLSGRSRADVGQRVRGAGLAGVVGNHGMEAWHTTARARQQARRWARTLGRKLEGVRGAAVEDKGLSLAVHYRQAREKGKARARIVAAAAGLGAVRLVGGKDVVNVLPAGAPHKGTALERALARLGCDRAIYVGDDDTDEDVFALDRPGRLLAVRVGRKSGSAAAWFIRRQADIDRLLLDLVALRAPVRKEKTVRENTKGGRPEGATLPPLGEALDFMRLLWAIDHGLQRRSKRMAAALGVTGPQRLVIRIVGRSPGISAGRLARVMHLHPSTLTGILHRLEERGLLERGQDERDLRRAVLTLSPAGRRLDVDASGTVESLTRGVLSSLPRRQVAAAREVLHALAQGLEREPATPRGPKPRR